jgi:hypothetical protein
VRLVPVVLESSYGAATQDCADDGRAAPWRGRRAFETDKMSEDLCRPRIEALAEKLRGLQSRHAELTAAMDEEDLTARPPMSWRR